MRREEVRAERVFYTHTHTHTHTRTHRPGAAMTLKDLPKVGNRTFKGRVQK